MKSFIFKLFGCPFMPHNATATSNASTRHCIRLGMLVVLAVSTFISAADAHPYASGITNYGGGTIGFILNENAGSITITYEDGSTNANYNGINTGTNLPIGAHTFQLGAHTSFAVAVFKLGTGTASLITNSFGFTPRGVDVNRNPGSSYFGRVYAVQSAANGINVFNSDLSLVYPAPQSAGVSWKSSALSPYRIFVAPDNYVMAGDASSPGAAVWRLDPNIQTGQLFLGPVGESNALTAGVFGTIQSRPLVIGNPSTGQVTLMQIDGDLQNGSGQYNSLMIYSGITLGALPWQNHPSIRGPEIGVNLSSETLGDNEYPGLQRGPNGYIYASTFRNNLSNPNVQIYDQTGTNQIWNSYYIANGTNADYFVNAAPGGTVVGICDVGVSPDGLYMAGVGIDNHFTVVSLTNGIPDVSTLYTVVPSSFAANARGIAWDSADNLYLSSSGIGAVQSWTLGLTTTAITSNDATTTNGNFLLVTSTAGPPRIIQQPASLTISQGNSADFTVTASGSGPLNYQWFFGEAPLPGATNPVFTIAQAQVTDAGQYSVKVTNLIGSLTSSNAALVVLTEGCSPITLTEAGIVAPGLFSLSFQSQEGTFYSTEYKNNLTDPSWTTLINMKARPGGTTAITDPTPPTATRFYRVVCYGQSPGGQVHASVYATVPAGAFGANRRIALPDIPVFVKNDSTQVESQRVPSNLNGWYAIPNQPSGNYELQWQAPGFGSGASPQVVSIMDQTFYAQPMDIVLRSNVIFGRVTFSDGGPTYFEQQFFGLKVQPTVSLLDIGGATVAGPVRPNVIGEYVLPNVPLGNYRLFAQSQGAQIVQSVTTGPATNIDLVLPNRGPVINAVSAANAGRGVRSAAPGATLTMTVEASDPDGDSLHFLWQPTASLGAFSSQDATNITWTLPLGGGTHTMFVVVMDGKGGYAVGQVSVSGDGEATLFTGQITDTDGMNVSNATVVINGNATHANGSGAFSLSLVGETNHYVVSITQPGYELYSKVLPSGGIGEKFILHKAQHIVINPLAPIQVTEPRTNGLGAQLAIGANSLVDSNGILASGPLDLFISTLNLDDPEGRLPGDFGGLDSSAQNVRLVSSAAVDIEISDAAGNRYNLMPGKTATLQLPVDLPRLASAPSVIPIWFYNPSSGLWMEDGTANLNGSYYDVTLPHFSVINADVEFTDAACMRLIVPADSPLKVPFNIMVSYIVNGVTVPARHNPGTVSDSLSVISRLPANTPILLQPLDANGIPIPGAAQTVNSGTPTGSAPEYPAYPYTDCNSFAILTYGFPTHGSGAFLNFAGANSQADAAAYYQLIDPSNAKSTFTDWKTANGFDANDDLADTATAVYGNQADLGFGRVMHMKKQSNGDTAFYVSNYLPGPSGNSADIAAQAQPPGGSPSFGLIATVAMEFSKDVTHSARFTKFYAFKADGTRFNNPILDSQGPKFMPALCIDCHGGNVPSPITAATDPNLGSKFIPFDVGGFAYSALVNGLYSQANQETPLKTMNAQILALVDGTKTVGTPAWYTGLSAAIEGLIQGWYGGPVAAGSTSLPSPHQNPNFVPAAWITPVNQSTLYSQVVQKSCRSCHTSQGTGLDWASFQSFNNFGHGIQGVVCTQHVMPNAEVPFDAFWLSTTPSQSGTLSGAGLTGWDLSTPCQ